MDAIDAVSEFLTTQGFPKTLEIFKIELKSKKDINSNPNENVNPLLRKVIGKAISIQKEKLEKYRADFPKPLENPQAEGIMENFMNKLVQSKKLDKTREASSQIKALQGSKAFQKIISCADRLFFKEEVSSSYATTEQESDAEQLPRFGGGDEHMLTELASPAPVAEMQGDDDELLTANNHEPPSTIIHDTAGSFCIFNTQDMQEDEEIDEYKDDDDLGFETVECSETELEAVSKQTADRHNFPARAERAKIPPEFEWEIVPEVKIQPTEDSQADTTQNDDSSFITGHPKCSLLPPSVKFPNSNDDFYPVEYDKIIYDCYSLKVVYDREKTGFEESKDFQIVINSVIAGRFQVIEFLGSAAFSKAIQCLDIYTQNMVCMKIIENNKDYVDQSLDEIKLLNFININGDPDQKNVLKIYDCFYYKEHLFIVTELLRDNLYEFGRYNRENEDEIFFTVGRLQRVTFQILTALEYIHSLRLVHCDLKPENILMKSYSRCEVKVIDFGSSCFIHDHLSSYVQSRSYRAPEVILGCKYDFRIDIWSLGCILAELFTGNVLFQNDTVQGLLARIMGIIGPFPEDMFTQGRLIHKFFTKDKMLYQPVDVSSKNKHLSEEMAAVLSNKQTGRQKFELLIPKKSSLKARLRTEDNMFLNFVKCLLDTDKDRRPTATQALQHPWIRECKYVDGLP